MRSVRDEVLDTLDRLPDGASLEELLSELHFKAKVLRGVAQAERGETIPNERVMEELDEWLQSLGR